MRSAILLRIFARSVVDVLPQAALRLVRGIKCQLHIGGGRPRNLAEHLAGHRRCVIEILLVHVATPDFERETYDKSDPLTGSDRALGLVYFFVVSVLEREDAVDFPGKIESNGRGIPVPAYAIDDQTAIKVVDGTVEVVSEGHWKLFTPARKGVMEMSAVS